jgi:mannose-P-dolichol utilization defect protein 1
MKLSRFFVIATGILLCKTAAFVKSGSNHGLQNEQRSVKGLDIYSTSIHSGLAEPFIVATASNTKGLIARALGGVMAGGALLLYTPIISNLLRAKSGEGLSTQTWIFNLLGFTSAILYPMKRGFPVSTYIEGIALCFQSVTVLALLAHFNGQMKEFLAGMAAYTLATVFLSGPIVPDKYMYVFQILATIFGNYAQIPQILLSYKQKKSSWSFISAFLSTAGNLIRVYTTLILTKDPYILVGHILGASTNAILLAQIVLYSKK